MPKVNFLRCDMVSVESIKIALTTALISVSGAFASGGFWKKEDTWGVAFEDGIAGEDGVLMTRFPKGNLLMSAADIVKGDKLWLNETTQLVSATDGGSDVAVGIALEDAASGTERVKASFRGF